MMSALFWTSIIIAGQIAPYWPLVLAYGVLMVVVGVALAKHQKVKS